MDFNFTQDQEALRELTRKIFGDHSTDERLKALKAAGEWHDKRTWDALAQASLLGVAIPEAYGGMGMGLIELGLLCEETGRAVAQVPAIELHIVGGGALRLQLEALAAELALGDRVRFCGPTDDTTASYRTFDVFVLSSRTEQMPLVLLEAMASGLPVVATDVGDVRAVLPPAAAPFVVPASQPDALGKALRAICDDAAARREQGHANRARVVADYEAGRCLDRFLAVYRTACGGRGA